MALAAGASCPAIPTGAHLGRAPPSPQPLLPPQVCGEKNRFEKLMEYFRNEDSNIDFMVSGGGGWAGDTPAVPPAGLQTPGDPQPPALVAAPVVPPGLSLAMSQGLPSPQNAVPPKAAGPSPGRCVPRAAEQLAVSQTPVSTGP